MIEPQTLITWQEPGEKGNLATARHGDLLADVTTEDRYAKDNSTVQVFVWQVIRPTVPGRADFLGRGEADTLVEARRQAGCRLVGVDADTFAVKVEKPVYPDMVIGPVDYRHQADAACAAFSGMRHSTAMPENITWEVVPYDPAVPTVPVPTTDSYALAEAVAAEKDDDDAEARFPDLWARLHAFVGYDRASSIYQSACMQADRDAEIDRLNSEIGGQVVAALNAVATVRQAIGDLGGNRLYDEEWIGPSGADALAELDAVMRKLRHVQRIAEHRADMLKGDVNG